MSNELIKQIEGRLLEFYGKKIPIFFKLNKEAPNGRSFKWFMKFISIYGNWFEIESPDKEVALQARLALLMDVGHELGHIDHEPRILAPLPSKFRNHIREIRADYCAIEFTMWYLEKYEIALKIDRVQLIEIRRNFLKRHTKAKFQGESSTHPSIDYRCNILLEHSEFNESLIREIGKKYCATSKKVDNLCSESFVGRILQLQQEE